MRRWLPILSLLPHAGRATVAASALLNVVFGLLPIAVIWWMSLLLATVPHAATEGIGIALALTVGSLALQQLLGPFQTALAEVISRRIDGHCVQLLLATSFRDAPIATLEQPGVLDRLADIRSAFDRTTASPGDAAAATLALLARYVQLAGAVLLIAVVLDPLTALVVGATAIVIRFGQRGSLGRFGAMWDGLTANRRRLHYVRTLATGTDAAKEIRVLGLRGWLGDRLRAENDGYLQPFWAGRRRLLMWPFVGFATVGLLGAALALAQLARGTAAGELSLLQFAVAVQAVLIPIRFGVYFPECDVQTQFGTRSYTALTDFIALAGVPDAPPPPPRGAADRPVLRPSTPRFAARRDGGGPVGAIRFEGVAFGYPGGHRVFTSLDLELPAGRSTAIVGLNGAGKTTLVKLLARFYDPDGGRITVGGTDLAELDPRQWQRRLAVIFQDFNRYELSAAENIGLGDTDEAALLRAADRAGARDVVDSLPGGLTTNLFSRYADGRDLSGGQWQRIALARALHAVHSGASVLILDEPTAQLDVRAEVEFYDQFLTRTEGLTSIVISHRFSTVRRADHIVVLEHGTVVERGDHDSLLAADGRYAEMFHLQASRFAAVGEVAA
ncbi:ATP-binding cassette subfamily B protein [Allocatelliglobosispora scoriae]|uniref:ATP-binding cassette subfamily B protein n=1 Tax=Allocatelliglobosispora scoriae TaxID=643052 RepID=A0A841BZP4_9ACTN|nr:ABC transporter ATP-binding protein/permease [Allocatelliglobosispora scoriae]MBB5872569.1 ATP-binding cassette subfamily B protein [Allocatelliglobosispora scoriae]